MKFPGDFFGRKSEAPKPAEDAPGQIEKLEFEFGEATRANEMHRDRNEDAYFSLPASGAFGVFDGVGGRRAGDVASGMARDYVKKSLAELPGDLPEEQIEAKLKEILLAAHNLILEAGGKDSKLKGMTTTACILKFYELDKNRKKIMVANMGDCRAYVLRASSGKLEQITLDDSAPSTFLLALGKTEEEVRESQSKFSNATSLNDLSEIEQRFWDARRIISSGLGKPGSEPTIFTADVQNGDIVILTTDGIHDILTDEKIAKIVGGAGDCGLKAGRLVQAAEEEESQGGFRAKGGDDKTGIVIKVGKK